MQPTMQKNNVKQRKTIAMIAMIAVAAIALAAVASAFNGVKVVQRYNFAPVTSAFAPYLPHISEIASTKRYERSRSPSVRRNSIRLRCLTPSRCIGSWSKLNRYFGYPSASFVNGRNSRSSTLGSCTLIDTCT